MLIKVWEFLLETGKPWEGGMWEGSGSEVVEQIVIVETLFPKMGPS